MLCYSSSIADFSFWNVFFLLLGKMFLDNNLIRLDYSLGLFSCLSFFFHTTSHCIFVSDIDIVLIKLSRHLFYRGSFLFCGEKGFQWGQWCFCRWFCYLFHSSVSPIQCTMQFYCLFIYHIIQFTYKHTPEMLRYGLLILPAGFFTLSSTALL